MKFIDFPEISFPIQGIEDVHIPKMVRVRQNFDKDEIADPSNYLKTELKRQDYSKQVRGKRIAITVGSRGIPCNLEIVKVVCDQLKEWEAIPFIVPAMGSHGAGRVEGNLEILSSYGITEENLGVPICASMEVVQIGNINDTTNTPVYCDKYAAEADGIIIYNKIKPHTDFKGKHESGLLKMMTIGLGKHIGCSWFHKQGFDTFAERIPMVASIFIDKLPIIFAIGVVQNAYDRISNIMVFPKDKIIEGDAEMLCIAKNKFPRFKFDNIDVLIIDRIGKNISGEGADPNVTGRGFMPYFKDDFHTKKLFIRGLTEESHHNACGLGLADITTRRCLQTVDWESTWINLTTNTMIDGAKIPMYQNTDYDAIRVAIRTCTKIDYSKARVVRIKDTLSLNEFEISESMLCEVSKIPDIEILTEPYKLDFHDDGYLDDFE